jgi:Tat protein secretion system quality control protein TatD with DNase activity
LRDSLAVAREDSIVLETDAPYLAPQKMRGKTNYPAYIQHIYEYVLTFFPHITTKQIEKNIQTLFTI